VLVMITNWYVCNSDIRQIMSTLTWPVICQNVK
jgi:hypothetical protein